MNKLIIAGLFFGGIAFGSAQTTQEKVTVEKTENASQAVHNVLHPKTKQHNGYKVKKKTPGGKKIVKRVNRDNHTVKIKTKKSGDIDKHVKVISTK